MAYIYIIYIKVYIYMYINLCTYSIYGIYTTKYVYIHTPDSIFIYVLDMPISNCLSVYQYIDTSSNCLTACRRHCHLRTNRQY